LPQPLTCPEFLDCTTPILDVRSPSEFAQGHLPGAVSFPLFTDAERTEVGICYKQQGREQAVELGFALAGPKFAGFIAQAKQIAPNRQLRLHCWRGGMRSEAVAWVLGLAGFEVSLLKGGYKAFRRWVLQQFEQPKPILILGGMTGTGKTDILQALRELGEPVIDLEHLASHRGSSFGGLGLSPQPTQEQFENQLALAWAALAPQQSVWLEAESRRIGCCRIPDALFGQMERARLLEINRPLSERLAYLVKIYGGFPAEDLITATERIRKRLGGERTQAAVKILDYYDRTYRYDLQRRQKQAETIDLTGLSAEAAASQIQRQTQQLEPSLSHL
jgi:tRNA 2-selenouridine synthase